MTSKEFPGTRQSSDTCILYDPSNGRIVHTHQVAAYGGANVPSVPELAESCIAIANKLGHDTTTLKTLAVSPEDFKPGVPYKVDVQSRRLIEESPAVQT
jgi:hypothetical protein